MVFSTRSAHSFVLDRSGQLHGFGWNSDGQLGVGNTSLDGNGPQKVLYNGSAIVDISCGSNFSLLLDKDGHAWSTGEVSSRHRSLSFTRLHPFTDIHVAQVSAGSYHAAALTQEGQVWTWGTCEEVIEFGLGREMDRVGEPTPINLPPVRQVVCGADFTLAEDHRGSLWGFGNNQCGQLGMDGPGSCVEPLQIDIALPPGSLRAMSAGGAFAVLIDSIGGVWTSGQVANWKNPEHRGHQSRFLREENFPPLIAVACGWNFMLGLDESKGVWTWGQRGQTLGMGIGLHESSQPQLLPDLSAVSIAAGNSFSLVTCTLGKLYVFGSNSNGKLGLAESNSDCKFPTLSPLQPSPPMGYSRAKSAHCLSIP